VGIYLFIRGFLLLRRRKLILNTPVSKVRSAPLGLVEISGLAVGPYTVTAPITQRPCYFHRTLVWEWKRQGRSKSWVKVAAECNHVPFFIDDNTGKVMVDPRNAELDLHRDFQQEFCDGFFTTKEEVPPNVHAFLSRHGIDTTNKIKVEEFCIKPKNALFLLGTVAENPGLELTQQAFRDEDYTTFGKVFSIDSDVFSFLGRSRTDDLYSDHPNPSHLSPNQRPTQVIRLTPQIAANESSTQQQKIAAALTKAGISNPAAWTAAGVSTAPACDAFDQRPAVVLKKGENNPTFLISWRSQREVARTLGWKCSLMIWGGPALSLLCAYMLQALTHWF
jgi:hypothetical protein